MEIQTASLDVTRVFCANGQLPIQISSLTCFKFGDLHYRKGGREHMPKNKERAVSTTRVFIRRMVSEYKSKGTTLRSVQSIFDVLNAVPDIQGKISYNLLEKVRGGKSGPAVNRNQWIPVMDAITGLELDADSSLFELQKVIRKYHRVEDDPLDLKFSDLFCGNDYSPDLFVGLQGEFVLYRQVTSSELVYKALLTISAISGSNGFRFQLIRADTGMNRGRYAEGRILDSHYGYTLVGSLFAPDGVQDTGAMIASIAKMRGVVRPIIHDKVQFATGLHSLFSDFTPPCASKMILVRSEHESQLGELDGFASAEIRQVKLETFASLHAGSVRLSFEDAVEEICELTGIEIDIIFDALSNETARSDTLTIGGGL